MLSDTRFRVENNSAQAEHTEWQISSHISSWNTQAHSDTQKEIWHTFILEKYGTSYCTDEKHNRSAQSDP